MKEGSLRLILSRSGRKGKVDFRIIKNKKWGRGMRKANKFQLSSKWYGLFYILIILIFAFLYYLFTPEMIKNLKNYDTLNIYSSFKLFFASLYYSVVTITTLGFGDISPNSFLSMIFTLLESLLGITVIGLFLNGLSHERSSKEEREKEKIREEEKEKYEKRMIKEEREREKTIILKYHSKLNIGFLNFNAILFSIFYGEFPLYKLSYEDQMKNSNLIRYNKAVLNNFDYARFLNLNNQSATFKYIDIPQKDAIRNEINEITQLLNEIFFNYDFSHNKALQVTVKKWLKVLENDVYLNLFELPIQNVEIEMLKKGINESEIEANNLCYKYIILKMIIEKSIFFYEEVFAHIQILKKI